ncbi:MAG: FtsX-like permease family protein [Lachnospiraceae bacterium]|nr:FtsX-like permease family protein [Lachnospiraceae bacterium]
MRVNNRKCVSRIGIRSLLTNKRRNIIAIVAIALTAVLFTSLFTIMMSISSTYETNEFRQRGGFAHATFKDVTEEQAAKLSSHRLIKEYGERIVLGVAAEAPFTKNSAEISYMDDNDAKMSYIKLKEGHMPASGKEVIMDTEALRLLGIEPKLGEEVTLSFNINGIYDERAKVTDTFKLVGFWEYDRLCPAHFINVSREYAEDFDKRITEAGYSPLRTDLNVMFNSSVDIQGKMIKVAEGSGFAIDQPEAENYIRFGVNPGYTLSRGSDMFTPGTIACILAFALLVVFTGYLIIYNIFQISVAGDIRFYGLLKTIGTTSRQIKRVIRIQALALCVIGIPVGLLLGFGLGAVLLPVVIRISNMSMNALTVSTSPIIFVASALFEILTVIVSTAKPGRMASGVSPVEAVKYTEGNGITRKRKATKGAKVTSMAVANMGRNRKKTVLVFVSLALALVILNSVNLFVGGFDREKWLESSDATDFVVGSTGYFKFMGAKLSPVSTEVLEDIKNNTNPSLWGEAYEITGYLVYKANEARYREYTERNPAGEPYQKPQQDGSYYVGSFIEAVDPALADSLKIYEGDISLLNDKSGRYIALVTDDVSYKYLHDDPNAFRIGDRITYGIPETVLAIDKRTGTEPGEGVFFDENIEEEYIDVKEYEFTVCAYVGIPYSLSLRKGSFGMDGLLGAETAKEVFGDAVSPMYVAFNTDSEADEAAAEQYISRLVEESAGELEYESKEIKRKEFEDFKNMFALFGGVLVMIIGMVGVLNFINAVMAGIIARKNEIAVLQAIGMTGRQVKGMLVTEGLIYTVGAGVIALILSALLVPLLNTTMEDMFWFYSGHFSVTPVLIMIPVFALVGFLIPSISYRGLTRVSVVERIRELG